MSQSVGKVSLNLGGVGRGAGVAGGCTLMICVGEVMEERESSFKITISQCGGLFVC